MAGDGLIDCHIHYMPSVFGDRLREILAGDNVLRSVVASRPAWRDLSVHRDLMQQSNVEIAIVLPYATELIRGLKSLGGSLNENMEAYNRSMSEDLSLTNGQFFGAAVVDPFGGKDAIAQLDRSLSLPSMVAIGLNASYEGISLDDPAFEPIYHVAQHHDVPVLVHPSSVAQSWADTLRLDNMFLRTGLGFFLDDALCIFRLAMNGVFDKYPDVRFMFCQLGGVSPFCCGRWDYSREQARILHQEKGVPLPSWVNKTLREYLSHVWLDTHTQDRHALSLVIAEAGEHVVVLGGDHPYTPPQGGIPYAMAEVNAMGVSSELKRKIERENALNLLGKRVRQVTRGA